jgi:DNA-binding CsgD family transcriptional regulator
MFSFGAFATIFKREISTRDFIMPEYLTLMGESLNDVVQLFPAPAHVKDVKQGQYEITNPSNLVLYGITDPNDLIGKSVKDLDGFMQPYWGKDFSSYVQQMDAYTSSHKTCTTDNNRILLNSQGFVHIQNMTKLPVLGHTGKAVAIFTFSENIIHRYTLLELYDTYKKMYNNKKTAIHYFTQYINIADLFQTPPTDAEIKVILVMRNDSLRKAVASVLKTEIKTIEAHVANIRAKLSNGNFSDLLVRIRNAPHGT